MGDVVDLKSIPTRDDFEFVVDMARFAEGILDEKAVKKKWRFDNATWESLGSDDRLVESIEAEKIRRIRDGSSKRERAQLLVVKAPDVLSGILLDNTANAKHRIDACKVLDDFAANGPQGAPAADRFQIVINLGADLDGKPIVEKYDKSIKIDPWDVPSDTETDTGLIAAFAMAKNKIRSDGGGEPI